MHAQNLLNPLLESDDIECAHQGKIVAFSNNKLLEVDGSCVLTKQDLLQAQIIGCTHQVAGFSTPCKAIVTILDSALSNTLIINGDSAIIAQQISQIFTDNGAPLRFENGATPKAKDIFELDEEVAEGFNDLQNSNENAETISESSPKSSNQSNAESNESNANKSNAESNKDSNNSQSMQDSQTNTNEDKKSGIDLRGQTTPNGGKVEWISQFDNGGITSCYDTCKKILVNSGLSDKSALRSPETMFQIATENKKTSQPKNQDEYLTINYQIAKNGIVYLDSELEKGYPVMVGVDYEFDRKIKLKSGKIDYPNTDKTTDHFIVIVGRKYDEKGDLYYLFYDVGTNTINEKTYKAGSNDNNRLYLKADCSLRGKSQIPSKHYYVVTQIRRNVR